MNEYKFVEPKTQVSNRTIVIDDDTIRELKEWKKIQEKVLGLRLRFKLQRHFYQQAY